MLYLYILCAGVLYHLIGSVSAAIHNKYASSLDKEISWVIGVFWPVAAPLWLLMWAVPKVITNKVIRASIENICLPYKVIRKQLDYKSQVRKQLPKATAKENK